MEEKRGRPRKYATPEEALEKKYEQTKESKKRKWVCEICNKTVGIVSKSGHLKSNAHLNRVKKLNSDEPIQKIKEPQPPIKLESPPPPPVKIESPPQPPIKLESPPAPVKTESTGPEYTARTLIFRRLEDDEDLPSNKKVAFKDKEGRRYVIRMRRYFNIAKTDVSTLVGKRKYDSNSDFAELTKILSTSEDFNQLYKEHKDYINCIIMDNVSMSDHTGPPKDIIDDDLFLATNERGVYDKYLKFDIKKDILDDIRANSCFVNLIVDKFKPAFEKASAYYKLKLTHEKLCEICGIEHHDDNIGLSVTKSLAFFKKYKIGLCVYGPLGRVFKYRPENINKNITPRNLYIYIHNNHCYEINNDIRAFEQIVWKPDNNINTEIDSIKVSDRYIIRDNSKQSDKPIFVKNLQEIVEHINQIQNEDTVFITFIYNHPMVDLLFEIINTLNYTPKVNFIGGIIMSLIIKLNNVIAKITGPDTKQLDMDVVIREDEYETYHQTDDAFYDGLLCRGNLSYYSNQMLKIGPKSGYFGDKNYVWALSGIDSRKAYTSDFMDIKYYPVFNGFDIWQKYDDHKIDDFNQYIVRCDNGDPILFNGVFSRCYGYKLNRIDNIKYDILYYKRPSNLIQSNSKDLVKQVYDSSLPTDIKKFIVNKNLGSIEKKQNKKTITNIFKNYNEAFYYQTHLGKGQIYTLTGDFEGTNKLYLLCVAEEKRLANGFLPIKELIYDIRDLKNYMTYNMLESNNIHVYGIKTDSLLIEDKAVAQAKNLFDLTDKIGGFKIERGKYLIDSKIESINNELPDIQLTEVIEHDIKDELDSNELNAIFESHNTFIKGALPGVGKTTAARNNPYKNTLFVSPYNKLCQQLRNDGNTAITLNVLLGIGIDDSNIEMRKQYDLEPYDCIVFDEILLYNPHRLYMIQMFMQQHQDKRYLCTGDVHQRKPFNFGTNNIQDINKYQLWCLDQMFNHQITLKESKRLNNESDKNILVELKKDIFDTKVDIITTFKKYGIKVINDMKSVTTMRNICLFNFRCDRINNYIAKYIVKKEGFYEGLEIVCRQHFKTSKIRLFVNYHYVIKSIGEKYFVINEPVQDTNITLDINKLKYFKLPYANTCDSVQGLTISDKYTIFDCNTPYIDRYYIWTSLTRATDLKNIQIFEHNADEVMSLKKSWVKLYFKKKIDGYKYQDKRAGRDIAGDYVDEEWIKTLFRDHKTCLLCNTLFEVSILDDNTVQSNITVDRMDNHLPHLKSNCQLMCIKCNVSKH